MVVTNKKAFQTVFGGSKAFLTGKFSIFLL